MLKLSFYDNKGRMVNDINLLPTTEHVAKEIVSQKTFEDKKEAYVKYAIQFRHHGAVKTELKMILDRWADDYKPIFYIA